VTWVLLAILVYALWLGIEVAIYIVSCLTFWRRRRASLSRSATYWSSGGSTPTRKNRSWIRKHESSSGTSTYPDEP
jgi:hypothetical protein